MPINPTGLSICKLQPVNTDPRRNKWACPHTCIGYFFSFSLSPSFPLSPSSTSPTYLTPMPCSWSEHYRRYRRSERRSEGMSERPRAIPLNQHKGGFAPGRCLTSRGDGKLRFAPLSSGDFRAQPARLSIRILSSRGG